MGDSSEMGKELVERGNGQMDTHVDRLEVYWNNAWSKNEEGFIPQKSFPESPMDR